MALTTDDDNLAREPASVTDGTAVASLESEGRNAVFTTLVKADDDITGLVAYSVFKQNELDWLNEFRKVKGRDPTELETEAYIIGERTARRLATYRHLADATLAGRGPDMPGGNGSQRGSVRGSGASAVQANSAIVYVGIALVVLIAVYFIVRAASFH